MIRRVLLCALLLAGCDQPLEQTADTPASQPVTRSATAGPGPQLVAPAQATALYSDLCLATAPTFDALPNLIEAPFVQHSRTGTYYHPQLNLSVKLVDLSGDLYCSMVFETAASEAEVRRSFAALAPGIAVQDSDTDGYFGIKLRAGA